MHVHRSVNVVSGIAALQYLSVPMWSTLRRLTTLITMGGEVVMLSKEHSSDIWTAVVRVACESPASSSPSGQTVLHCAAMRRSDKTTCVAAQGIMVAGAFVAGVYDLAFDATGYA
jgi:hypothetical protein